MKGNSHIKRILCEAAQGASRAECYLRERFSKIKSRRGYKKAIIATAHKMLKIIYVILTKGVAYEDKTVDYETLIIKKNSARWLKKIASLKEQLGGLPADLKEKVATLAAD